MHPHASRLRCPNGVHLTHPDIAFARFPLAPLIPLFSLRSRNAHKGFLSHAPQDLARLGTQRQHRFHEKTPSAFVADVSHTTDGCRRWDRSMSVVSCAKSTTGEALA
jgi:hypothetical protein